VLAKHWPTASDPSASAILAPLAPNKAKLLVLKGLNMDCAVGEQHQAGIIGFLTGSKQTGSPKDYSSYASIDQVIATRLQADPATKRARASLQFAVRWATGKSHGLTLRMLGTNSGVRVATDALAFRDFESLSAGWHVVTIALNNLNRSMGLKDGYPFVLSPLVLQKLRFVHDVIQHPRARPAVAVTPISAP